MKNLDFLPKDTLDFLDLDEDELIELSQFPVHLVKMTEDNEWHVQGFKDTQTARSKIAESYLDQSGWFVDSVWINGKKVEFEIEVVVSFKL